MVEVSNFHYLDRAFVFTPYKGVARTLIQLIKFQGAKKLIPYLGELIKPNFLRIVAILKPDYVTFVPTHPFRVYFVRGFDQTEELVKQLYPNYVKIFKRRWLPKKPLALVGNKTKRRKHIKEDFYISFHPAEALKGKRVLIVDDILTTGSTGETLAFLLKSVGAKEVFLFTVFGKI